MLMFLNSCKTAIIWCLANESYFRNYGTTMPARVLSPGGQVPNPEFRAEPYKEDTAILYAGEDKAAAQALVSKLFPEPSVDVFATFGLLAGLVNGLDDMLDGEDGGGMLHKITLTPYV
jgi:hypothetical protein